MKLAVYLVVLLVCVQLLQTDAWLFRRRRKSKPKTTVDVKFDSDRETGVGVLKGGITHQRENWGAGITGAVDTNGNWGVGLKVNFRKRSINQKDKQYTVTLSVDQCNFNVYDINRDGYITIDEIKMIFGEDKGSENLFNDINMTTDDDVIDEKEFIAMVPLMIKGCDSSDIQGGE